MFTENEETKYEITAEKILLALVEKHREKNAAFDKKTKFVIDPSKIDAQLPTLSLSTLNLENILARYVGDDQDDFLPNLPDYAIVDEMEWGVSVGKPTKAMINRGVTSPIYTFRLVRIPGGAYNRIIEKVFHNHFEEGKDEVHFARSEFEKIAENLNVDLPKNLGDIIYSYRYRRQLPRSVRTTAPFGKEWIISGTGDSQYKFRLSKINRIKCDPNQKIIPIFESTPQLIVKFAKKNDEQELLAKIRYNRLIDIFLGITSFSLQSHLRTKVPNIGQIEIDEFYVGVDTDGVQYVIPVQAKTGSDKLAVIQTEQDIEYCRIKFPSATCKAISAHFLSPQKIAMFELEYEEGSIKKAREKVYELISTS